MAAQVEAHQGGGISGQELPATFESLALRSDMRDGILTEETLREKNGFHREETAARGL